MESLYARSVRKYMFGLIFTASLFSFAFLIFHYDGEDTLVDLFPNPTESRLYPKTNSVARLGINFDKRPVSALGLELGYVVACTFGEQLESAMYDLYQLADLTESWQMRLGEPTIQKSKFQFPFSETNHWKLRNLFNISNLNRNLRKSFNINYDLVVGSEEMQADRSIADMVFIHWTKIHGLSDKDCFKLAHLEVTKCFQRTYIKKWAQKMNIRNVICLGSRNEIDFKSLMSKHSKLKQITLQNIRDRTKSIVVFSKWNGIRPNPGKFFYLDPNFHQRMYINSHSVLHSKEVLNMTESLRQTSTLQVPYLGVHIRLERLIRNKLVMAELNECITSLERSITTLLQKQAIKCVVAFTDYKASGSSTCANFCARTAKKLNIDERLRALGVTVNPELNHHSKASSLTSLSGFVSNVEQELLAQSAYLILVGFGSFQMGITQRYYGYNQDLLSSNSQERIVRICN